MILQKTFDNKGVAAPLIISGIIGLAALAGIPFIKPVVEGAMGGIANVLAGLMELLLPAVGHIFIWLGGLAANLINIFAVMNPFDPNTLAPFIWNTFKNIVYVVIIFLSLYAGFMYITGKDDQAQQLIYKIIVIALLINFSFLFAKEIFNVSFVITKNLASNFGQDPTYCPYSNCVGTAIHTSLLTFANPEISQGLANALSSQKGGAGTGDLFARVQSIFAHMIVLILYFIYTTIMFIFAGLFVGRFVMITFLVGLLPLAIIEWAIPKHSGRWEQWTKTFMIWTINIPVLLILVLIGFSITTAGIAGDFSQKLQHLSDARIYGGASNADANAQAYAGLLRYLFIVAYYAFAINYAQKIGGGAAVFGVNFAKGTYLTMAGAVVGAGKIGLAPVRQKLGGGLEKLGENMTTGKFGSTPVVGGLFRGLGAGMTGTGKKIRKTQQTQWEQESKTIIDSAKGDPKQLADILKRYKGGGIGEAVAKKIAEQTPEKILATFKELGADGLKDRIINNIPAKKAFDKKLEGLVNSIEKGDRTETARIMSRIDWSRAGISSGQMLFDAMGKSDAFKGDLDAAIFSMDINDRSKLVRGVTAQELSYLKEQLDAKILDSGLLKRRMDYRAAENLENRFRSTEPGIVGVIDNIKEYLLKGDGQEALNEAQRMAKHYEQTNMPDIANSLRNLIKIMESPYVAPARGKGQELFAPTIDSSGKKEESVEKPQEKKE